MKDLIEITINYIAMGGIHDFKTGESHFLVREDSKGCVVRQEDSIENAIAFLKRVTIKQEPT